LATAFNATILALLDAGIPLKSILGAVTCIVDSETNQILLDPTSQELANAKSTHTFVFDNKSSITSNTESKDQEDAVEVATLYSDSTGLFSEEEYFECAQICYKAVQAVHGFIRTAVQKKLEKEQQQIHS
jgi:exosome complex component RRP46